MNLARWMRPTALVAMLVLGAGCGDDDDADGTVTRTFDLTVDGAVDDPKDRIFVVTYFYSPGLGADGLATALSELYAPDGGGEAPTDLVMGIAGLCGPAGWDAPVSEALGMAVSPTTDEACAGDGAGFSAELAVPRGTAIHYSVDTALLSDLENSAETFDGNQQGDPMELPTADDVEIVDDDTSTSSTYDFGTRDG